MGPFFVLSVSEKYNWHELKPIDLEVLREIREEVHLAIQHVAAVGRTFLEADSRDRNASLAWIPGLWRIAGKWVAGTHTFRSSLSFEDFSIYLVDEKVNPLASIHLDNKSHNQVLVWLEEHIINLDCAMWMCSQPSIMFHPLLAQMFHWTIPLSITMNTLNLCLVNVDRHILIVWRQMTL